MTKMQNRPTGKRGDVLIVEDNEESYIKMKDILEEMDVFNKIVVATDGNDAKFKMSQNTFSLIVMNNKLPKKSGADIIRELFEEKLMANKNVVLVSATFEAAQIKELVKKGVIHLITKPIDEEKFKKLIIKNYKNKL